MDQHCAAYFLFEELFIEYRTDNLHAFSVEIGVEMKREIASDDIEQNGTTLTIETNVVELI